MSSSISITPVAAAAASTFVQSIGVNVHMGYYWTTYNNVSLVENDLAYLGINHVRDELLDWSNVQTNYQQPAADGIKFDFLLPTYTGNPNTTNLTEFVSMVDALVKAYPGSVSAVEGSNEVNIWPVYYDGGTTLADDAALQQALYAAVRADPDLNGIPVYNLTLGGTDPSQFEALGNLSGSANYANSHAYPNDGQSPQWSMSIILPNAEIDAPGLPVVITETGYETNPADTYSGADQTVQAKYTLDTLVDAFLDGVSQTYLYELFDEGGQDFGLFNADGTPKLAAAAIHNLTTLLADPSGASGFSPGSLSFAIPNMPSSGGVWGVTGGQQLLLEKSNGTFDLVLWNEPIIWNASTESEIATPIQNTTIDFAATQKAVLIFDPLLGSTPIAAYLNAQSIQVALTDHPVVVEIPSEGATLMTPTIGGFNSNILTGAAAANSTVLVFDGNTEIGSSNANASGAWSFATGTLAQGGNVLTVMAVDAAGDVSLQSSAFNVTNSAAGPAVPIIAPIIVNDTITSTNQVILTGTGEANSTVSVFDTTLLGTAAVNASGVWTYTTPVLVNGDSSFAVITTDAAGNTSAASNYVNPVINLSGPTATSVVASGPGIANTVGDLNAGHVVTLTVTMSENVTVAGGIPSLTLNDGGNATYAGGSGSDVLTFSYTVALGQNTSHLTVTAVNLNNATIVDGNGNNAVLAGSLPIAGNVQIDTAPPPPPVISNDTLNSNNSITLTGTAAANSIVTVYDGQAELGTATANATGGWSFTTAVLGIGSQVFTATATDTAGNVSAASNAVDPIIVPTTTTEIDAVYAAVLQRSPSDVELTASLAILSTQGSAAMIAAVVNSSEAISNVYPTLQMFELAFGHFPGASTLDSMVNTDLTTPAVAAAVVGSQAFANTYNSGTLIDPNSPLTAGIVDALYDQALGHMPTQATLISWLSSGLTIAQAFLEMATSQSYFALTQSAIEQDLTSAAITNAGLSGITVNATPVDLTTTQVGAIYGAILQRAPTATEVTAALALNSASGDVGAVAALVDSAEAISNVYPVLQMFDLAFGRFPVAATLASMVETGLSVPQLAAAIVASQAFANTYNDGTLLNPNSPVTANIVDVLYTEALGHTPTEATLNGWLSSNLTIAQAFEAMVTSESYFATAQTSIEQYLIAAAINQAGLTSLDGAAATGALTLGTSTMPLTQAGLVVLGGSGLLMVVASAAGDAIIELNTSTVGGIITANGANDTVDTANGPNTITADGAGDTIKLGVVSTGTSITSAQTIHAAGGRDVITFATTAANGTALTWTGESTVDGGDSSPGIGANSTVNFGNNTGGGSETVVVTGELSGATTSGGTSTTGVAMITLGNVVDNAGDKIILNNAVTEVLAGSSAVNVTAAGSLAQALDMAALAAGNSQSGGIIAANTGVLDWFQYGGNTYVVEAINGTGTAESHPALAATDEVIKIVGLVSLTGNSLMGHTLTL